METLNFPNYFSLPLVLIIVMALIGLGLTISAIYGWKVRLRQWKNRKSDHEIGQPSGRLIGITFVGPFFLFVCTLGAILNLVETHKYRNINVDEVTSLRIYRIDEQGRKLLIDPRLITNNSMIRNGLSKIKHCNPTTKQKWYTLSDGYLIEVFSDGEKPVGKVSVYKDMHHSRDGSVARLKGSFLEIHGNSLHEIYRCPQFLEWVNEQIDPLFSN